MAKRVLLLGNYPPPYGGVPSHLKYLADYLAAHAWQVHVVSFVGPRAGVEHHAGYPVYRLVQRSRWAQLARPGRADARYAVRQRASLARSPRLTLSWVATAHFVRKLVRRHQIPLISAYHVLGAGMVGARLAEERGTALLTTVFGEIYSQPELHRRHIRDVLLVLEQSSRLLSCSRHCAESFRLLGLSPRVETVYYGVDTAHFAPGRGGEALRQRLGIPRQAPVVVFVGRMVREMGLHVLLAAIPTVLRSRPETRFLLVGKTGALTGAASTLAARYPRNVVVAADAPLEQLPAYYDAATLAVAPSINARACLGLAIAEAMATAKPVIGARVGGTAEVIAEGETGLLVPPEDDQALAEAIIGLSDDEATCQRLGQRGRERALALFDTMVTNRRMEHIFEEVLA